MFEIICPDGKARHFPYHNREDADEDAVIAAKDCSLGYEIPLDHGLGQCPGGTHVVQTASNLDCAACAKVSSS